MLPEDKVKQFIVKVSRDIYLETETPKISRQLTHCIMGTENLKDQNLDGGQEKNTSSDEELQTLEQEVKKQEETAESSEDFAAKKKAELEQRRKDAIERKKKARGEAKEVKKELKELEEIDVEEEELEEKEEKVEEPEAPEPKEEATPTEDELYERFKARERQEQAQKALEDTVDSLIEEYPEASTDQLKRIEDLVPSLKTMYPDLSTQELVNKAVLLEIGEVRTSNPSESRRKLESGDSPTGSSQRNPIHYQYAINAETKAQLAREGKSEAEHLELVDSLAKRGLDISRYGVRKLN